MADLTLTERGRERVKSLSVNGPAGRVLGLLDEHKSMSLAELASESGLSLPEVRSVAIRLKRKGWIVVEG